MKISAGWGVAAAATMFVACSSSPGVDPSELPLQDNSEGGIPGVAGASGSGGDASDAMSSSDAGDDADTPELPDLNRGLVAWYPLHGDALDASGKGNHGEVLGATLVEDRFGRPNSAYHFGGSALIVAPGNGLPLGQQARTVVAWVRPDEPGVEEHEGNTFMSWGTGDCIGKMFGLGDYQGQLTTWVGCSDFHTQLMLPNQQWSFVATRFEPPKAMTNWVGEHSAFRINEYVATEPGSLRIGVESIDGSTFRHWFKGSISDIRIYDRALSDEEIGMLRVLE